MPNYLLDQDHLLVWPVLEEATKTDLFLGQIGVKAARGMTTKALLDACLDVWQAEKSKPYRLVLIRTNQEIEIPVTDEKTIDEFEIRNGDPFKIIAS